MANVRLRRSNGLGNGACTGFADDTGRGQSEDGGGADIRCALELDLAAVRLREFSRDRQSEACSGKFAVHADIGLNERFKNPLQVLLGDSDSGVANNEAQAAVGLVADGELDLALGRSEFDRVDEEIVEDLPEPHQIAANFS